MALIGVNMVVIAIQMKIVMFRRKLLIMCLSVGGRSMLSCMLVISYPHGVVVQPTYSMPQLVAHNTNII